MPMDNFDVEYALEHITILVDSREHPNAAYHRRIRQMSVPITTVTLSYGDYSCRTVLPDEREISLQNKVVVERKMSLDEICGNFGRERKRFIAEFERAKADGARVYLLIENATFTDIFSHNYRSKYAPNSLIASIFAWIPRYNTVPVFCKPNESGKLIAEIMKRELKERLEAGDYDERIY